MRKEEIGLSSKEVIASRRSYGENVIRKQKKKGFFRKMLNNLKDPIIRILLIAVVVNLIFTYKNINWAENIGILIAVVISTVVSAISESGSEKAFERLQSQNKKKTATVRRDGVLKKISAEELVVGDIVLLTGGSMLQADGSITSGNAMFDEAAINGESKPVEKSTGDKVYGGSLMLSGECTMKVDAVGEQSVYGSIAREIQIEDEISPLKKKLSKLAKTISKIGYFAAVLVALTYLFNILIIDSNFQTIEILLKLSNMRFLAMHLIKAITIGITVVVVAVPEGLPMMITVVLSSNMKKMLHDQVLVRKLVGIETAGCMNILFTDKTGTLTEGRPTLKKLILPDGRSVEKESELSARLKSMIATSIFTNSSAQMIGGIAEGGNITENALCNGWKTSVKVPDASEKQPFDSNKKYSSILVTEKGLKGSYFKGAPEILLPLCTSYIDGNAQKKELKKENLLWKTIKKAESQRARVILFAYSEYMSLKPSKGLSVLAIAILEDGLRKEAKTSVTTLSQAGVHTVMVTGDSVETATAIAENCAIKNQKHDLVLTGAELSKMSDGEISESLARLSVVARAMPSDKSRLVKIAKTKNMVVGMTGDGINDAPALKSADVGFAIGGGTDVAKEAADIVILDNNLASIVQAVLYGRTVFKSIRKFITFQLTMNLCAVGVSFIGQLLGIDNPITVVQMLWVNIIMDTLGGLAFAGEYPLQIYLKEKAINRNEAILTKSLIRQTLIMGGYTTVICSLFLSSNAIRMQFGYAEDPLKMLTAFFGLFILMGIAICFTARSERLNLVAGLMKNKAFVGIMCGIIVIQILMLYFGGKTFRCVGISTQGLLTIVLTALTVFPVNIAYRILEKYFAEKTKLKKMNKKNGAKLKKCQSQYHNS